MLSALKTHWPEYLMEAWGLGMFMIAACFGTVVLWHADSPLHHLVTNTLLQRFLMGLAMGMTAIGVVYSPWGKRSGAHINPAVTLTFFRLGKIAPADALFYIVFQFLGALMGVLVSKQVLRSYLAAPHVNFAITVPGPSGVSEAFVAELLISFGIMLLVLVLTNHHVLAPFTGLFVGGLIVLYITFESPLSGMSMNPARTVGSALPAKVWSSVWLYFVAPALGMMLAAEFYISIRGLGAVHCAKLNHAAGCRCIFRCGYAAAIQSEMTVQKNSNP